MNERLQNGNNKCMHEWRNDPPQTRTFTAQQQKPLISQVREAIKLQGLVEEGHSCLQQDLGAGCFHQCLSSTQGLATAPSTSYYLYSEPGSGGRVETMSTAGSCHPNTQLGTRHIPQRSGQEGGGGLGDASILLLRRQRALHDLIKMPIKGLRR